jgi:5-methylcytosine-specific restriction endonuclease McrA
MRDLVENGERTIFLAEVDRISNSGNGVIEIEKGHINLGPLPDQAVGENIKGVLTSNSFSGPPTAYCVNEKYISAEYLNWVTENFEPILHDIISYPKVILVKIQKITKSGNAIVRDDPRISDDVFIPSPPEKLQPGDIVKVRLRKESQNHSGSNIGQHIINIDDSDEYIKELDDWAKKAKDKLKINGIMDSEADIVIKSGGEYEKPESTSSTEQSSEKPESTSSTEQSSEKDLDELREKAQKESTENVTESTTSRTQTTQQYHRSQAVRDYVMGRADGVCEGCGETAPFTSKTGDPYLHAHHIHELSDGGSDTPDTVIALCPNCHYRVHHGKDGDEYNSELEQKLSEIEG